MGMMEPRLAVLLALFAAQTAQAAPFAWIANSLDHRVSRIDLATHEAVNVPVALGPRTVGVNPSGTRAYVASPEGNVVSVIDGESATVLHGVPVPGSPRGIAVNLAGTRAWVGNDAGQIDVIDGVTGTLVDSIPTPNTSFNGADLNPQGTRAYFAAAEFAGQMIVVDTATDAIVTNTVVSPSYPALGITVDPTGTRVYVTLQYGGAVAVVDATTNLVIDTIPLACELGCSETEGITVSPDGLTIYVAAGDDGVIVIDAVTRSQVDVIATGFNDANGIDITPDGSRLYVTDDDNDIVLVIDVASRSVIGTLAGFDGIGALNNFIAGGSGTTPSEPPILDANARKCQTAVGAGFPKLAGKAHKLIADCLDDVQRDRALGPVTAATITNCARSLDLDDPSSKVSRLRVAEVTKLVAKCGSVPVASLGPPCDDEVTDITDLAQCVTGAHLEGTGRAVAAAYAGACALLDEVSLDDVVPGVCE